MTDTSSAKFNYIPGQLPDSLLGVCCKKRTLMDESGMIRIQMGTRNTDIPHLTLLIGSRKTEC
jgi:hypothetical protein